MHALETLFSFISLQFRIVLNTTRMHVLKTLIKKNLDLILLLRICTAFQLGGRCNIENCFLRNMP